MTRSMKNRSRRTLVAGTLVALAALMGAPVPGTAASVSLKTALSFQKFGSGNPDLSYLFDGWHRGSVTRYNLAEAGFPASFRGMILKGGSGLVYCNRWGLVSSVNFECTTQMLTYCPGAEGVYNGRSELALAIPPAFPVKTATTANLYANCPPIGPPGCNGPYSATKILAVDLVTGRVTQPEWHFAAPRGLTRNETVDGKSYFSEEWALVSTAGPGQTVALGAASEVAWEQVDAYSSAVAKMPGFDTDHQYLVVEAARHIGNRVEPLLRLRSLESGEPVSGPLSEGRVTFRVGFSPHGRLESVETLEGSERTARILAEDLRVELPSAEATSEHEGHRAVVFATFEVEAGRPRFIAAVPLLPQCCCGQNYCI